MRERRLILAGVVCLAVAALALLAADTSALRGEDFKEGCGDWWCAPRNALPLGCAILFGGLGIVAIGVGVGSTLDDGGDPVHERSRLRTRKRR